MLNCACQAIPVGCPWLQSCYALQWARGDHTTDHTISDLVKQDLEMFKCFLDHDDYSIKSVPFLDRLGKIHSALEIKADAVGNPQLGFGCFLPHTGQWFRKSWRDTDWFTSHSGLEAHQIIYQLELFAIMMAFRVFGPSLQGRVVILRSDNIAVVNLINGMSSFLEAPMELLCELTLDLHVFADIGKSCSYRRYPQQRIRPDQQRQILGISKGKSKIPRSDERAYFQLVATILDTLDATSVFRQNQVLKGQCSALCLFKETCERQNLPLELKSPQLRAFLCELYNLNYTATTISYHWHPIYDIILHNNITLSDKIITLYNFIREQARPRIDKKLPVSHKLVNQQLKALDLFLAQGYENTLAKAMVATAWAAQLRVSEYSSKLVVDIQAGDDHNLHHNGILVEDDDMTVIFASDKSSKQHKECFIPWDNVPINNFKEIIQDYDRIRNTTSPVFFCHEDGTNLTPNDMANWIELSTSQTDWQGLKITSHCYRIGGTSYLHRSGLDIPNLQRSGRWSHTDTTLVEHYLKPGLYSASPDTIRNTLPQYKASISISRAMFLRDIVTMKGGVDHPFNKVLEKWGFSKTTTYLLSNNPGKESTSCKAGISSGDKIPAKSKIKM